MQFEEHSHDRADRAAAEVGVREALMRGGPFVAAVETTRMPMVVTDPTVVDNPIVYANAAFLAMCGYDRDEVLGQNYFFLVGGHADPEVATRVEAAMAARRSVVEEVPFRAKDGREAWVSMFVSPVVEDGRVVRHFASFMDVTERVRREHELRAARDALERQVEARARRMDEATARLAAEVERRRRTEALLRDALAERQEDVRFRDFLVREVNHRTKNALQIAVALLAVQARQVADPACRAALEAAMGRLRRVSEVHALLAYQGDSPGAVDVAAYLRRLCRETAEAFAPPAAEGPSPVRVEVAAEEALWGPDVVVSLGLIVGETLTNALKYAFPEGRAGRVRVDLRAVGGGRMRLRVADDGVGMMSAAAAGRAKGRSLGLQLVEALAKRVRGEMVVTAGPGGAGTVVVVTFPAPNGLPS